MRLSTRKCKELPWRTLYQRDLFFWLCAAVCFGSTWLDHHALGGSSPNAWQQGAKQNCDHNLDHNYVCKNWLQRWKCHEMPGMWKVELFSSAGRAEDIPIAGLKDAAFRHYSGPVGKPTYEMKLRQGSNQMVNGWMNLCGCGKVDSDCLPHLSSMYIYNVICDL